ncbi:MAG: chitinase [Actinomycetota bacterium]|nr:chitinase [Actinomycetota bacterium]
MADDRPRTRLSLLRLGLLLSCLTLAIGAGVVLLAGVPTRSDAAAANAVPTGFAGYVDVTATPTYHFEDPISPATRDVILAFVVADKDDPCLPSWGTYYTLDKASRDLDLDRRIEQLRVVEGNVRVSFGGAINDELATVCTDEQALRKAYADVVDRYDLQSIDLDIEGEALTDTEANQRRAQAVKAVQDTQAAQDKRLGVWLTLPTDTAGLTAAGIAVLTTMLEADVDISGVNGMTMNFGATKPETMDMSNAVEKAALKMQQQISDAYGAIRKPLSESEAWEKVGVTPMIGQNDVVTEQFTIGDAKSLNTWALNKGIGLLSMWSLNRDATCGPPLPKVSTITRNTCSGVDQKGQTFADVLAVNTAFPALPSDSSPEPTATASPSETSPSQAASTDPSATGAPDPSSSPGGARASLDDPATSPYPIWDPTTPYPVNVKVVWQQNVYQAKRWSTGFAPDTQVARPEETPWRLIGPVAPGGEEPMPLPSVGIGTYPAWEAAEEYPVGSRVQVDTVPYVAKWTNTNRAPDPEGGTKNPWALLLE